LQNGKVPFETDSAALPFDSDLISIFLLDDPHTTRDYFLEIGILGLNSH